MKKILLLLLALLCISSSLSAQKGQTESWYTYWGLGYASIAYPVEIQDWLDVLKKSDGFSNFSMSLDLLGFYWHVKPKTIAGFVINGVGDRYEYFGDSFQINQYIYGASVIHYPGKHFGSDLFLRADLGLAKLNVQDSGGTNESSESGFGFLIGGGYSMDLGGTRLLFNANWALRQVESESYKTFGLSIGGLF
jgi:hypothetical protein